MPAPLLTTRLLAIRPDIYARIAEDLRPIVVRQHVRRTARQLDGLESGHPSPRIVKVLLSAVRRWRYP